MFDIILRLLIMMAIGGLIGWSTNKIAIKMLFRPIKPVKILFFTFQGVFPKRKDVMAKSLAETIEKELISKEEIIKMLFNPEKLGPIKDKIKIKLIEKIKEIIPDMILMMLGNNIDNIISNFIDKEGDTIFSDLLNTINEEGLSNLDIEGLVKNRLDSLDFIEFENIVFGLMKKELRHIEIIGLILGLIIGLAQFGITFFIG